MGYYLRIDFIQTGPLVECPFCGKQPGDIYTIERMNGQTGKCPHCGEMFTVKSEYDVIYTKDEGIANLPIHWEKKVGSEPQSPALAEVYEMQAFFSSVLAYYINHPTELESVYENGEWSERPKMEDANEQLSQFQKIMPRLLAQPSKFKVCYG